MVNCEYVVEMIKKKGVQIPRNPHKASEGENPNAVNVFRILVVGLAHHGDSAKTFGKMNNKHSIYILSA